MNYLLLATGLSSPQEEGTSRVYYPLRGSLLGPPQWILLSTDLQKTLPLRMLVFMECASASSYLKKMLEGTMVS